MIDVQVHYKGSSSERHKMPAVWPRPGEYVTHDGKVWRVDAVVYNSASTTWGKEGIDVYAVQVNGDRREELERQWATWSMKEEQYAP
jgi:hypothetical protein